MTDCAISYSAVSHPRRRWRWTIPTIIGIAIATGIWGHHQPEPVSCEPGSQLVMVGPMETSPDTLPLAMCLSDKITWSTPGYKP
jgi:hypothetical protein